MLQLIRKQLRAQGTDVIWGPVIMLAAGIVGMSIMFAMMKFDVADGEWFCLGTMLGGIVAAFYGFIWISAGIGFYFNMEVAMGCSRKEFFFSYYLTGFVMNGVYAIIMAIMCIIENALGRMLYPGMENDIDLLYYIIRGGIPAVVVLTVIGGFCGTLVLRYGKKAFWVLWAIWMVLCLGGPRISDAVSDAPDSVFGKIGTAVEVLLESVSVNIWILFGAAIVLACGVADFLMLRRQQVTM